MTAKKYFSYLLMLYIASTLIFAIGSNIVVTRILDVLLLGSFIIYFLTHISMKFQIHKFLWIYILFAIYSFFSIYWSIDTNYTIGRSIIVMIIAINLVVIYNIVIYFKIEKYILYGIILGAIYNYLVLFDVIPYVSEYTLHFKHRFVGTTNNPNILAIYMLFNILASFILLKENQSKFLALFLLSNILLAFYSIIMTASKKGVIFSLLLLSIYLISSLKSKKSIIISVIFILIIVILVNSNLIEKIDGINNLMHRFEVAQLAFTSNKVSGSTYQRLYLIETAYEIFSKDFGTILLGTGQRTFELQNKLGLYAHNNYMEIVSNLGLIGLFIFYFMYVVLFKDVLKVQDKSIKYFLLGFLLILLLMDNALVSYTFKATFFIFIFLVIYINQQNNLDNRILNDKN